jgi:signal transduction histidine kinase
MRSFRQKVFLSYVALLALFLGLLFPFVTTSVQQIVFHSMNERADQLIRELMIAKDDEELIEILKDHKSQLFYRVGILDHQRRLLYDSHIKRLLSTPFFPLQFVTHPEVEEALQYGTGYSEEFSHLMDQKLIYLAKRFDFHGNPYVIRLAFPFQYIQDLRSGFTIGFLFLGALLLVLFSAVATIILNHLSSPIREIIHAIKNYQEGNLATLPNIRLKTAPQDEFTHLANTVNSLSQRVQAEIETVTYERNEREAVLESLAEGVLAVDANFFVSYANRTALQLLGLTKDIIGKPLPKHLPPAYRELLEQCCRKNDPAVLELEIKQGHAKLYISVVATPRKSDGGALLVLHDISVQHRMLEMRKAFIANASHELRTPITVIRGFAETLHDNSDLPPQTINEVTKRIVDNCHRMTFIIKNLLTLSDIENLPSFHVSPVNLLDLVERCIQNTSSVWKDVQVHVTSETCNDFCVEVDPHLMEMAIHNLLDNAAKYSDLTKRIDVTIKNERGGVTLEVKDYGIGIAEHDLEHIFQRFFRAQKAAKIGGSGLGLSIVETIIQKHFGKIDVRSEVGKGSIFTIFIPSHLSDKLRDLETKLY